jgi:ADP-dependent NAD(P)H-hydrate dehydratase / NAD(P)H-hydrate epimerase
MQHVLTSEEMRWCDETATHTYGIPGLVLMENAGRGVVEFIKNNFSPLKSKHILIVCGRGNNGGDGFVVAKLLSHDVASITVLLVPSPSELQGDAKTNYTILKKLTKQPSNRITLLQYSKKILSSLPQTDLIIDGLFGTGFSGSVRKPHSDIIEWINRQDAKIVSIDIPSGVNGTTGVANDGAVQADRTVTFGALKSGLLCTQGRELAGAVDIIDIGIPNVILENKRLKTFLIESSDVRQAIPKRSIHAYKYSVGKVLVIAGSKGMTGAAAMCAMSALRSGAGAVMLGVPESVYPILARKLTEVMTFPLPTTNEGSLSLKAVEGIREKFSWADVMVIGPGLSQQHETQQLVIKLLQEYEGKTLIDADGLNALAASGISQLRSGRGFYILTPHVGEFSRLFKNPSDEIEQQRIEVARDAAKRTKATIVLKGVPTVTVSENGSVVLNSTGNPGMATAGSGDVLSGIIAALWAEGLGNAEAAWAGVYLHGLSGDIAAKKFGERSLVATDLIESLPAAFQSLEAGRTP